MRTELSVRPDLIRSLVPTHYESRLYEEKGIDVMRFEPVDLGELRVEIP